MAAPDVNFTNFREAASPIATLGQGTTLYFSGEDGPIGFSGWLNEHKRIGGAKGGPAVFVFIMIAGTMFFGFCYLMHRLVRKSAERRLNAQTGEVKISKIRVDINGVIFDWRKLP